MSATNSQRRAEKRPYQIKPRGHVWKKDGRDLDIFAYNPSDPHNGPMCVNCGYGFCHHCHDGPDHDCPKAKKKGKRK